MAKIYISSTYSDLKDYREEVYHALRKLGHDVVAMEDYTASDQRPLDKCLEDVSGCDVYIGIFAWRYGYVPPEQDKSITELEFRTAAKGKRCLIFLLDDNAPWSRIQMDKDAAKIEALREELKRDFLVEFFSNKDELAGDIGIAVSKALASKEEPVVNKFVGVVERRENEDGINWILRMLKPTIVAFGSIIIICILGIVLSLIFLEGNDKYMAIYGLVIACVLSITAFSLTLNKFVQICKEA